MVRNQLVLVPLIAVLLSMAQPMLAQVGTFAYRDIGVSAVEGPPALTEGNQPKLAVYVNPISLQESLVTVYLDQDLTTLQSIVTTDWGMATQQSISHVIFSQSTSLPPSWELSCAGGSAAIAQFQPFYTADGTLWVALSYREDDKTSGTRPNTLLAVYRYDPTSTQKWMLMLRIPDYNYTYSSEVGCLPLIGGVDFTGDFNVTMNKSVQATPEQGFRVFLRTTSGLAAYDYDGYPASYLSNPSLALLTGDLLGVPISAPYATAFPDPVTGSPTLVYQQYVASDGSTNFGGYRILRTSGSQTLDLSAGFIPYSGYDAPAGTVRSITPLYIRGASVLADAAHPVSEAWGYWFAGGALSIPGDTSSTMYSFGMYTPPPGTPATLHSIQPAENCNLSHTNISFLSSGSGLLLDHLAGMEVTDLQPPYKDSTSLQSATTFSKGFNFGFFLPVDKQFEPASFVLAPFSIWNPYTRDLYTTYTLRELNSPSTLLYAVLYRVSGNGHATSPPISGSVSLPPKSSLCLSVSGKLPSHNPPLDDNDIARYHLDPEHVYKISATINVAASTNLSASAPTRLRLALFDHPRYGWNQQMDLPSSILASSQQGTVDVTMFTCPPPAMNLGDPSFDMYEFGSQDGRIASVDELTMERVIGVGALDEPVPVAEWDIRNAESLLDWYFAPGATYWGGLQKPSVARFDSGRIELGIDHEGMIAAEVPVLPSQPLPPGLYRVAFRCRWEPGAGGDADPHLVENTPMLRVTLRDGANPSGYASLVEFQGAEGFYNESECFDYSDPLVEATGMYRKARHYVAAGRDDMFKYKSACLFVPEVTGSDPTMLSFTVMDLTNDHSPNRIEWRLFIDHVKVERLALAADLESN